MATCETCGHEYLDSYQRCPFCARSDDASEPEAVPTKPAPRRGSPVLGIGGVTLAAILLGGGLWLLNARHAVDTGVEAGNAARCWSDQIEVERAALVWSIENEDEPVTDLTALVPRYLPELPECDSGGTYTFAWDPQLPRMTCSEHGWHGDSP